MRRIRLRLPSARTVIRRYGVAAAFLLLVVIAQLVLLPLSPHQHAAANLWASTNVANLHHHPIPALVVSAFLPAGSTLAWLPLIALALFGANAAVGNLRLALVCTAGQVIGTLVSEGSVAYRIDHGTLAPSWAHIIDIGPSYVVVPAIVVAVMFGSRWAKICALVDFAILVFVGRIFADLTRLHVSPVGHLTALCVGALLGVALGRPRSPNRAAVPGQPRLITQPDPMQADLMQADPTQPDPIT